MRNEQKPMNTDRKGELFTRERSWEFGLDRSCRYYVLQATDFKCHSK